jgi:prepilin signal peptidase PulO-like enzyme (type II secretory pathway)
LAGALVFWIAVQFLAKPIQRPYSPAWPMVTLMIAIAVPYIIYARAMQWLSWRTRDEFEKYIQINARYWGAKIGLSLALPIFIFIVFGGVNLLFPSIPYNLDVIYGFTFGFLFPVLLQEVGSFIAHTVWRRSR